MWIAKPVHALTATEEEAWLETLGSLRDEGIEIPLSQTMTWAHAAEAVLRGTAYAVFSPDERVGGLVFSSSAAEGGRVYECVNGPLIHWDDPLAAPRQLATFATAVARAAGDFRSIKICPRWRVEEEASRLSALPFEPTSSSDAATMRVALRFTDEEQKGALHPRLRRSISQSERAGVRTEWTAPDGAGIAAFAETMQEFGKRKGFYVPTTPWFDVLVNGRWVEREGICFRVCTAQAEGVRAGILIAQCDSRAHYLFGYEERDVGVKSAISPAAAAHWRAMRECAELGVLEYDLNGYVSDLPAGHPYRGVCEFKDQFKGRVVRYCSPEFEIANPSSAE